MRWTKQIPRTSGFYWAKMRSLNGELLMAEVVLLYNDLDTAYSMISRGQFPASDFVWYPEFLVPPSFFTQDYIETEMNYEQGKKRSTR